MLENLILAQAVNLIHDPIIASDEQGRIVFTNSAHTKLTNWSLSELKGRNKKLVYDITESEIADKKATLMQTGVLYRKDGTKLTLNVTCSALKHPSLPDFILGQIVVFHPTFMSTENTRSSDDFVSTVSHELRTPLTSIRGFAETLIKSQERLNEENRKRFLQIIKDQSDHLTRLVEDLLFVSRLDNQKIHLVMRELDLKKHIDKICEAMANQAGGRLFIYDFEPHPLPHILADSDRLEQVLSNLIGNSIKYSPDHTTIKIKTELLDNKLKISIIDNGFGIPEADQELVFNRFSRLDNPLTRQTKGTGLGLYITKSLVNALNGEIWLEKSIPNEETIFSFTVPLKK